MDEKRYLKRKKRTIQNISERKKEESEKKSVIKTQ